jgi:hypothetical protein
MPKRPAAMILRPFALAAKHEKKGRSEDQPLEVLGEDA